MKEKEKATGQLRKKKKKKRQRLQTLYSTKPLMDDTDTSLHNQPSPKDLFQAGYSVLGSLGMVGKHVSMLQGSPCVCPMEPDCLTTPALWRK